MGLKKAVSGSTRLTIVLLGAALVLPLGSAAEDARRPHEDLLKTSNEAGWYGGHLVVSLRSEPKTLNPVTSLDVSSREVIAQMTGDLIHIDRGSQQTVPALAKSWKVSSDGLHYRVELRNGIRFSDGTPLDVEDVLFSFKVYLDDKMHSPQRDLLMMDGKPIRARKVNSSTLIFDLGAPYASAERLFDSLAILPRHLLEKDYEEGKLVQSWTLATAPDRIAGLGPFRLKQYLPGQRLILERNPYYWKIDRNGQRLPYLSEITFLFVPNEDAEVMHFEAGDTDVISRVGGDNYDVLDKSRNRQALQLHDLGPSLEYNFLFFNLNEKLPAQGADLARKQVWFRKVEFRQAVSAAIDREGMSRVIYQGRGTPILTHVTPGNQLWLDRNIQYQPRSVSRARDLLKAAGFRWRPDGTLQDQSSSPVEFTILTSASNAQRTQMATMIQQDLKDIGVHVQIVSLDFRSVLDRVFQTHDYEVAVMGLSSGDTDPNAQMNVWLSSGDDHLWNLSPAQPLPWEAEIDRLMRKQVATLKFTDRKRLYDRVQEIEAQELPIICLVSPNMLVGAKARVANFKPVVLEPHTLWNSEELFFANDKRATRQ